MVMRYLQNYSKIGLEVGAPDHGPRADGKVEGSGLNGEKLHFRAQGGPEPARLDNEFLESIQNNRKILKTIVKYQLNKFIVILESIKSRSLMFGCAVQDPTTSPLYP